jgi:hypothetical protein
MQRSPKPEGSSEMSTFDEIRGYIDNSLLTIEGLRGYIEASSVVSVALDPELVYDLMVVMPDSVFEGSFKNQFGQCFVVNDKDHSPPVFTRFKSQAWLRNDLSRRVPISLWIFGGGVVVQDPGNALAEILLEGRSHFEQHLKKIVRYKYLEFRSDRHNLRQAIYHNDGLAVDLLKSNVIKLALEIAFLATGRPYPYKRRLPSEAEKLCGGDRLVGLCKDFACARDPRKLISLSDDIVAAIVRILSCDKSFSASFLDEWWLHLD